MLKARPSDPLGKSRLSINAGYILWLIAFGSGERQCHYCDWRLDHQEPRHQGAWSSIKFKSGVDKGLLFSEGLEGRALSCQKSWGCPSKGVEGDLWMLSRVLITHHYINCIALIWSKLLLMLKIYTHWHISEMVGCSIYSSASSRKELLSKLENKQHDPVSSIQGVSCETTSDHSSTEWQNCQTLKPLWLTSR